jgi:hypothetical protein
MVLVGWTADLDVAPEQPAPASAATSAATEAIQAARDPAKRFPLPFVTGLFEYPSQAPMIPPNCAIPCLT